MNLRVSPLVIHQKNSRGELSNERMSNYGWIIYWKVARKQKNGHTSMSISSSSLGLENTIKRIRRVDFLMEVLATMGQLCTERALKSKISKNWPGFVLGLKNILYKMSQKPRYPFLTFEILYFKSSENIHQFCIDPVELFHTVLFSHWYTIVNFFSLIYIVNKVIQFFLHCR